MQAPPSNALLISEKLVKVVRKLWRIGQAAVEVSQTMCAIHGVSITAAAACLAPGGSLLTLMFVCQLNKGP